MSTKTIRIISCVLVLALTGVASAATYVWDKGGTTKLWNVAANWNPDGVPATGDTAQLSLADANCVIDSTVTAVCASVTVGGVAGGNYYLDMTGGTLTCSTGSITVGTGGTFIMRGGSASAPAGRFQVGMSGAGTFIMRGGELYAYDKIQIGTNSAGNATVLVEGGTVNFGTPGGNSTDLEIAPNGRGTFTVTGGVVNVLDQIKLAQGSATSTTGVARLNLYGGTLNASNLYPVATTYGSPKIDITKGTLSLGGDRTAVVNEYITRGWIVAYNGTGTVVVNYNGTNTIVTGYKVEDYLARDPSPADGALALRSSALSWTPGIYAASHDVYFGTAFADVNNAGRGNPLGVLVSQGQAAGTYTPVQLEFGQKYYWRIDEVNAAPDSTIYKGTVWSFTVEAFANPIAGANITATASSSMAPTNPANTINGSGLTGDLHSVDGTAMWASDKSATGPAWIRYDFDRVYKLHEMWVWNYNSEFEYLLRFGMKNVTVEYSADGTTWTTLGNYVFAQAPGTADYAHSATVGFGGLIAKSVKITAGSNYGGAAYGLSEVRFFSIPTQARQPQPINAATRVDTAATLSWWAGREAVSHKVYVGTDANALTLANTTATPSYSGAWNIGTTYYWRVDEVNSAATVATWTGDVWSFTTIDHFVVDDMESYNDTTHPIYGVWIDGYNTTNNGCQVGNDGPPYANSTTVHGGRQSMPLRYTNTSTDNSEAVRTFDPVQDWTHNGIGSLSLYFYGQTANTTTIPFFIKLTDQSGKSVKVIYGTGTGENVASIATASWTQWSIKLSSFTGVTLTKIKSITIGFGTGSGSGQMLIDDIWLTR
jgi:hypothetical protein